MMSALGEGHLSISSPRGGPGCVFGGKPQRKQEMKANLEVLGS
jgi:hypothetical protein